MTTRKITNCGDCAYAEKSGGEMWCKFNDASVSTKLVCDYFLDEYASPQSKSLFSGLTDENSTRTSTPQYTSSDIIAYLLTAVLLASAIFVFCVKL